MRTLLSPMAVILCSCTGYMHEAHSASGNYVRDVLVKVGGTASQRGSDGSSIVTDDQTSFRDLATAATTITGSVAGAVISKSNNALKATQATSAASVSKADIAARAATEQAKIQAQSAVTSQAIGAGATVTPITVTSP